MSTTSTTSTSTTSTTSTSTTIGNVTIEDIRTGLNFRLQDDSEKLKPSERDTAIDHAVRVYSKDNPLEKIKEDDSGDGTKFDFALPFDWRDNFSEITGRIEYPVSSDIQNPQYVDDNNWVIYEKTTGKVLRFLTFKPSGSYSIRYKYSIPHTVSDEDCTIYEKDIDAFSDLCAGLCFMALAAKHAETEEPTIEADAIDYVRKSDQYLDLAKESFKLYDAHMGKGKEATERPGAMATKDLDMKYAYGSGYLTHPGSQH